MLCVISRGNWNNGVNAGVRNRNLNNTRTNSNNNVGFASDSMPTPNAARADRQRGRPCRALRRNVMSWHPLVELQAHVGQPAKIGVRAPIAGVAA